MAEDRRCRAERERTDDAIRPAWHAVVEGVATDDPDSAVEAASSHFAPKGVGPMRVLLERNDMHSPAGEGVGEHAAPGAYLDDEVAGGEGRRVDELVGPLRPKEVLSETASPLVPSRPPVRGHGPSP